MVRSLTHVPGRVAEDDAELSQHLEVEGPHVSVHPLGLSGRQ